jgi:YcxB-like protein
MKYDIRLLNERSRRREQESPGGWPDSAILSSIASGKEGDTQVESAAQGSDELRLTLCLTREDYLRFYRRHQWRTLGWLGVLCAVFATSPFWQDPAFWFALLQKEPSLGVIGVFLAMASLVLLLLFLPELIARWYTRRVVRWTPLACTRQELRFSAQGMQSATADSSTQLAWSAFHKATETRDAFQLYLGPTGCVLLPFRQFPSVAEQDHLRIILRQNLGARASRIRQP